MGIWNLVAIITSYMQMLNMGTANAVQREMPYYLGCENLEMERKVRETHLAVVFIEITVATAIFLIFFYQGKFSCR